MVFTWKSGSRIKADPVQAAKVMNELADANELDAANLVRVSEPEDAPLHDEFDWDDEQAAGRWREHQARHLINCLVQYDENEDRAQQPVRVYFQVEEASSNYEKLDVIVRSEDKAKKLLKQALNELIAYKRKYAALLQQCDAVKEMDSLQLKMELSGTEGKPWPTIAAPVPTAGLPVGAVSGASYTGL